MDSQVLLIAVLIPLVLWEATWKGIALWKTARNNQIRWFIAIFLINSVGILPLIYLKFYQKGGRHP